jgi:uncharacterized protein (TIGR00730 family)
MSRFSRIAVYCASSDDISPNYRTAATALGHAMASRGIGLVFGGGSVGLMGTIADAMIERGGEVIGVIPEKLQKRELGHTGCTELHVVDTMHTRKQMMMDLADAFIAMPGGYGTMEELFEVVTWAQLNYHRKPVGVLNADGFFDSLITFVQHAVDEGFVREELRHLITVGQDPDELLDQLGDAEVPDLDSWLPNPAGSDT